MAERLGLDRRRHWTVIRSGGYVQSRPRRDADEVSVHRNSVVSRRFSSGRRNRPRVGLWWVDCFACCGRPAGRAACRAARAEAAATARPPLMTPSCRRRRRQASQPDDGAAAAPLRSVSDTVWMPNRLSECAPRRVYCPQPVCCLAPSSPLSRPPFHWRRLFFTPPLLVRSPLAAPALSPRALRRREPSSGSVGAD